MKKLNKVAMLFASAALVTAAGAQTVDNWRNGNGELVWKTVPRNSAGAMPTGRLLPQLLAVMAPSSPPRLLLLRLRLLLPKQLLPPHRQLQPK